MALEFIQEIQESRLISNKRNLKNYTYQEIADIAFLYFLTIQILRNELEYMTRIKKYVSATTRFYNFDTYRSSGNDLYQLLHVLYNHSAQKELKNYKKFVHPTVRSQALVIWLNNISAPRNNAKDHRLLFAIENGFDIKNTSYKAIRRLVEEWDGITQTQKQLSITRLLQAMRAHAPKSELLPWLEQFARKRKLEIEDAANPEQQHSAQTKSSNNMLAKAAIYTGTAVAGFAGGVALHRWLKK